MGATAGREPPTERAAEERQGLEAAVRQRLEAAVRPVEVQTHSTRTEMTTPKTWGRHPWTMAGTSCVPRPPRQAVALQACDEGSENFMRVGERRLSQDVTPL